MMQHPCARFGIKPLDKISKVIIVLSIKKIAIVYQVVDKKLCNWDTVAGEVSTGRWLEMVIKTQNFLPSFIISSKAQVCGLSSFRARAKIVAKVYCGLHL